MLDREKLRAEFRTYLNEAKEKVISDDYILKSIKKFKLKKDDFIVWNRPSKGYKNLAIAIDKEVYIYYLAGLNKVKIEFPNSLKLNIEQRENYNIGQDRNGFVFTGELKSKLLSFCSELIKEIDQHWLDEDIKEKQPKYPDMKF